MNRRQFIGTGTACAGMAAMAVSEKTGDGGMAPVSWADRTCKTRPVLPPGAHSLAHFASTCVGCGLCAAVCPSKCLRPSTSPGCMGRVELDFRYGWCKPSCSKCGEVCPAGAIEPVGFGSKRLYHVGFAIWTRAACIRATEGVDCHACEKHCPVRAIKIVGGVPVVDHVACVGCGACEHYCPARPLAAIRVEGVERHREIAPMNEDDLLEEMKRLIDAGHAAVVAQRGVIVQILDGRGLVPIREAVAKDAHVFADAVVADKVVGLGAAEIYVTGRCKRVWGRVMSAIAKKRLEESGIAADCRTLVPQLDCEKKQGGPKTGE